MPNRAIETLADSITTPQYKPHPIAACWPPVEGAEFAKMCESLLAQGLLHAITLYQGAILDGVTRYRGCQATGVKPHFREYEGDDPVGYALACNESRRQLDRSQRAMVAARLAQLQRGANQHASRDASSTAPEHASRDACSTTQANAAALMRVGRAQVQRARAVQEQGIPELVAAVDGRRITVATAARLVNEPAEVQRSVVDSVAGGSSVRAAIRMAAGDTTEPAVAATVNVESTPFDEKQVYAAYRALDPAAQERVFNRIRAERTATHKIKVAEADAESLANFKINVAQANGGTCTIIDGSKLG